MDGRRAFPFRDFLVARTYEPRADTTAMLVADALPKEVGVAVLRVEDEALERAARHAALAVVGTPVRRRPTGAPGGDASQLAARLGVPIVVAPRGRASVDLPIPRLAAAAQSGARARLDVRHSSVARWLTATAVA